MCKMRHLKLAKKIKSRNKQMDESKSEIEKETSKMQRIFAITDGD